MELYSGMMMLTSGFDAPHAEVCDVGAALLDNNVLIAHYPFESYVHV